MYCRPAGINLCCCSFHLLHSKKIVLRTFVFFRFPRILLFSYITVEVFIHFQEYYANSMNRSNALFLTLKTAVGQINKTIDGGKIHKKLIDHSNLQRDMDEHRKHSTRAVYLWRSCTVYILFLY